MKLSKNFSLQELTKSDTAIRKDIDNTPNNPELNNLTTLCNMVLQKVRDSHGAVTVTSGYRSPELNKAIGGSTTSDHCKGCAADFEVPGLDNKDLAKWIIDNLTFKQLILEFYKRVSQIADGFTAHSKRVRITTKCCELLRKVKRPFT